MAPLRARRKLKHKKGLATAGLASRVVTIYTNSFGAVAVDRQAYISVLECDLKARSLALPPACYDPYVGQQPALRAPPEQREMAFDDLLEGRGQDNYRFECQLEQTLQEGVRKELSYWALQRARQEANLLWRLEAARYGSAKRIGHHPCHSTGGSRPASAATAASNVYPMPTSVHSSSSQLLAAALPQRPQTAAAVSAQQRADARSGGVQLHSQSAVAGTRRPHSALPTSGVWTQHDQLSQAAQQPDMHDAAVAATTAAAAPERAVSALSDGGRGSSALAVAASSAVVEEDDGFIQEDNDDEGHHELDDVYTARSSRTARHLHAHASSSESTARLSVAGATSQQQQQQQQQQRPSSAPVSRGRPFSAPKNPTEPRHLMLALVAARHREADAQADAQLAAGDRAAEHAAAVAAAASARARSAKAAAKGKGGNSGGSAARARSPAAARVRAATAAAKPGSSNTNSNSNSSSSRRQQQQQVQSARTTVGGWQGDAPQLSNGRAESAATTVGGDATAAQQQHRPQSASFAAWVRHMPGAARAMSALSSARTEGLDDPELAYQQLELESRRAPQSAATVASVEAHFSQVRRRIIVM
jgi:trimeric autotransporter adhesin